MCFAYHVDATFGTLFSLVKRPHSHSYLDTHSNELIVLIFIIELSKVNNIK